MVCLWLSYGFSSEVSQKKKCSDSSLLHLILLQHLHELLLRLVDTLPITAVDDKDQAVGAPRRHGAPVRFVGL